MIFEIEDESELEKISNFLITNYKGGVVVLLHGNLGSGKTTLVKNFVRLYLDKDGSSPTFSVMFDYGGGVYHYDIYRVGSENFIKRGLSENFEEKGFHFVEWADDKIKDVLNL